MKKTGKRKKRMRRTHPAIPHASLPERVEGPTRTKSRKKKTRNLASRLVRVWR
jgi:hypothetical protein